jgi:predicted SAM-dependent methyltransferase
MRSQARALPCHARMAGERLNLGCGPHPAPGWINADIHPYPGVDLCGDVRNGLSLPDAAVDVAVAIHLLQDLPWDAIAPVLAELKRVLRPGGLLRIGVPDLDRAIDAYRRGDAAYFYVPDDDAKSLGAKLVTQITWYGSVRTPFTFDYAREQLERAGFQDVTRCAYRQTAHDDPKIVELDTRERESLFVEARA